MKFSSIYNLAILHWGNEIDISDYAIRTALYPLPNGEKRKRVSKSSENLSRQWNRAEKITGHKNPYTDLMVWTMYQVFHSVSESLFAENQFKLLPKEIDKKLIANQYLKNLQENGWEKELDGYIDDNP
jgi:hypothetical protein